MSDRFFLDTNIFVYSFDPSAKKKAQTATQLIRRALSTQKGIVSYQVIQEFLNLALKRFAPPMTAADAGQYLSTVLRPLLAVHSSYALFEEALRHQASNRMAWYDSLIVAAAIASESDLLYSEDLQHGQKFGSLRIVNPFL
jgi:predicted nucleic acid-binding protein